ncbi:MAG TPA: DUF2807 domain-containing protein [Candidatus Alistipes merdipullorum]|nr:DUF2807 domain-containing protein [Candidatus Alistipes merdipullorum]
MKNTILSIATMLAATAMTVSACTATAHTAVTATDMSIPSDARITGSGNIITRSVNIADFSRIETSRAVHLVVEKRSGREAIIEADDNIMPYVIVEVDGGCLNVGIDDDIKSLNDVTVKVTVPSDGNISAISASSASRVTVETEIKSPKLMLDASSAANINITKSDVGTCSIDASSAANVEGAIKADNCVIDMSSASDVNVALLAVKCDVTATSAASATLSGEAGDIEITVSSAAKVDAMDLNARNADVSASSGGSIKITCMKSIDASASSGGSVKYAAKGDLDSELKHTSSGGSVKKL